MTVIRRRMNNKLVGNNFALHAKKNENEETPLDVLRGDNMDSPIHTNYIQSGGANYFDLHVDEATPSVLSSHAQ